ncbi:hypothetical protein [Methanothermobacter sp. K4]|uniref:hypothetical protein n=1 Tax=Methanothermobacter sp. K4 TaxID=2913262 RepID=UPI001EDB9B31|nr:hypothetical protein [Methanothermobacter sp. K4]MCG2827724.1 hypothetical protein [Methanothermobacter sp. K4]
MTEKDHILGFFCDTGFIIGLCRETDKHHQECTKLTAKYPIEKHDYFTCLIVCDEVNHWIQRLTRNLIEGEGDKGTKTIERKLKRCFKNFLLKIEVFDVDDVETETTETLKEEYNQIILNLQNLIGYNTPNQINDIKIIATALIWGAYTTCYAQKCFLTVDKGHISNKKDKIYSISCICLKRKTPPIRIKYVGSGDGNLAS